MLRMLITASAILCAPLLSSCQHRVSAPVAAPSLAAVGVDPRIELMSVVQLLSGYFLVSQHDLAYKRDVQAYFAPYKQHRAVTLFKTMSKRFRFSTVPDAMMRLTPPPALDVRVPFSDEILDAAGNQAQLDEFIAALRDFARVSRFDDFYRQHRTLYESLANSSRAAVQPALDHLADYTGIRVRNAKVVLGPLLHDGGFAAFYELPNGTSEAYAFVGPTRSEEGRPDFGDQIRMEDLAGHEFAHLVINPITKANFAEVDRYADRLAPIAEAMRKRGYSAWESVVNEHIIRAISIRMTALKRGDQAGQEALKREVDLGYAYVPALVERLKVYEANRRQYPSITAYYRQLLAVFGEPLPTAAATSG